MHRSLYALLALLFACPAADDDDSSDDDDAADDDDAMDDDDATPDDDDAADDDDATPDSASVLIDAKAGGEISLGDVTLVIPAGALAVDTTLTLTDTTDVTGLPDSGSVFSAAYDFGPDDLQFLTPASLRLVLPAAPEGLAPVVSWVDGTSWSDLPSGVVDGVLHANVDHFTVFAGRWVSGVWEDCSFNPCGGDLVGTWDLLGACTTLDDYNEPGPAWCPGVTGHFEQVATGEVTYDVAGTFEAEQTTHVYGVTTWPGSCLAAAGLTDCAGINEEIYSGEASCVGDPATSCVCTVETVPASDVTSSGTWTTTGPDYSLVLDAGPTIEGSFCIDGDRLSVDVPVADQVTFADRR